MDSEPEVREALLRGQVNRVECAGCKQSFRIEKPLAYLDREQMQLEADLGGVLVTMVQNGGWTSLAGLQSNDVLMAIDGQSIANEKDVETKLEAIKQTKPKAVIFKVRRGIHTQFIEVEPIWSEAAE